jgi:hypothetical protein
VRIVGISLGALLVVVGPFLAILAAKAIRRRSRRERGRPAARIVGGWDEYLDAAADAGHRAPAAATAATRGRGRAGQDAAPGLAVAADRAVFSDGGATADDATEFWRIVDAERTAFTATRAGSGCGRPYR